LKNASTRQLLLDRGVDPEAVARAEGAAATGGGRLCTELLALGAADEQLLASVLSDKHGVPGVDLSRTVIALGVLELVPRQVAEADLILPLSTDGGRLHLAMALPRGGEKVLDEVRFVTGLEVSPYIAVMGSLRQATAQAYDAQERGAAVWRGAAAGPGAVQVSVVLPGDATQVEQVLEVGEDDVEPLEGPPVLTPPPGTLVAASAPAVASSAGGEAEAEEVVITVGDDGEEVVHSESALPGPRRVLVVDDEPEIRTLLERTLTAKGFTVETAADGEEALARIQGLPDLVLLDAMLPKVHGFEVCRRSRSDPHTRSVPIVMMTAIYRGWRFAQDARETYGAEDYIEKPFRIEDLLRRIGAVLESTASRGPAEGPSAEPQLKKGKELLLAGQIDAAIAAFEEATRTDAFSAEPYYQMAKALRAKGDHFRAMTAFERAVELRPAYFPALRSLAALYSEKGFRLKATETLERALAAAPDGATRESIRGDLLKLL
jgi:DNA-binding response OmpR family regulator